MIQVLCRRRKNNPLLVGEPGVGKTALAEGLALRIHQGEVPDALQGRAGLRARPRRAGRRHALSRRLRGARQAGARRARASSRTPSSSSTRSTRSSAPASASGGTMDAGNLLKPALASGALRCIGSTTFSRREAVVRQGPRAVAPLPEDRGARAVRGRDGRDPQGAARRTTSRITACSYTDEALAAAVTLSARHLKDLHLPDKAIDVIDEAGRGAEAAPAAPATGARRPRSGVVDVADIEAVVAKMARVPVQAVSSDDRRALRNLDAELKRGDLRPGRGDRRGRVGDQAVALGTALARQADRQLPVRRARPASARPSWRDSSRGCSGSSSCASTCPSTWRSTPCRA